MLLCPVAHLISCCVFSIGRAFALSFARASFPIIACWYRISFIPPIVVLARLSHHSHRMYLYLCARLYLFRCAPPNASLSIPACTFRHCPQRCSTFLQIQPDACSQSSLYVSRAAHHHTSSASLLVHLFIISRMCVFPVHPPVPYVSIALSSIHLHAPPHTSLSPCICLSVSLPASFHKSPTCVSPLYLRDLL